MKLLIEQNIENIKFLKEEDEKTKEKNYFVTGIFMQANIPNKNGRFYPLDIVEKEIEKYNEKYVKENRAMGELGHPQGPSVNLERVSHIVKELKVKNNNVYGKAKILDTPCGKIVKNFIDENVKLGISSRGLGSLKEISNGTKEVQDDFQLNAIDIVSDPSAPEAFVEGILENKEWIYENGIIKVKQIEEYKKDILRTKRNKLEEKILSIFKDFIEKL